MKINETFGQLSEQDVVDETRRLETEILAQLKSEFQDFVTQTRERLRMVSESLVELEREHSVAPPVTHQHVDAPPEEVEAQTIVDADVEPLQAEPLQAEPLQAEPLQAEPLQAEPLQAEPRDTEPLGPAPNQVERPESTVEPAPTVSDDSEAPVGDLEFWPQGPSDTEPQPSITEDASNDASFPSATDLDSDPTERLKAIKQRLARQIENS